MNAKKADGKKCKGCFLGLRCIKNKSGGLERNWFLCLLLSDLTKRNQSASTSTQQLWGREAQQNWRGIVRVNSKAIEVWAIMHWYNSPMWGILMWTSGMEDVIWKNKQGEEERDSVSLLLLQMEVSDYTFIGCRTALMAKMSAVIEWWTLFQWDIRGGLCDRAYEWKKHTTSTLDTGLGFVLHVCCLV